MKDHIFLSVLGFSILALILGVFGSSMIDNPRPNLGTPWQIDILPDGSTQVFTVNLGHSRLAEVEQRFREQAEFTMFVPEGSDPVVEAYFNELTIAGLKAKMVVAFDLGREDLQAMYDKGVRISTMGSGTRKVTLHPDSIAQVRRAPIASLTYMPATNLDAELLTKRFGQPDQKIADPDSDAVHWLYAAKGLDVALSERSKEVILYVQPANFDQLRAPLLRANENK